MLKKSWLFDVLMIAIVCLMMCFFHLCLVEMGWPDGSQMEIVAQELRSREVTAGDAVVAFCREMIHELSH